jgi:Lar family restriction alleviation protein
MMNLIRFTKEEMMKNEFNGYNYSNLLLPCPFCGPHVNPPIMNKQKFTKYHDEHFYVGCTSCGAEHNIFSKTIEEAIAAWNTRFSLSKTDEFQLGFEAAKQEIIRAIYEMKKEIK